MKKFVLLALVVLAAIVMIGCASPAPSFVDMRTYPITATGNAIGSKTGEATTTNILSVFANGDGSVAAAAKAGGISRIGTVSLQAWAIGGLYGKYTTVVTGD